MLARVDLAIPNPVVFRTIDRGGREARLWIILIGGGWRFPREPAQLETTMVKPEQFTDERRLAEAWGRSNELLQVISDALPALISYVDRDYRYQFCNRAYTEWFGLAQNEVIGKAMREVLGEAAWILLKPYLDRCFKGERIDFEIEAPYQRGGPRWVRANYTPHRDGQGTIIGVVVLVTDVSERRRWEQALEHSEERYREFIANSSEGVWRMEFDPPVEVSLPVEEQVERAYQHGRMAECNDAMARMYGLAHAQDLVGKSIDFMLPGSDPAAREFIASIIRAAYRVNEVESAERDADGDTVYFTNSMAGVVENGRLARMWGTQRDITERKRAEETLRRERERLSLALTAGAMGVYDLDLVHNNLWWSSEIYRVFGVSPETFTPTREAFAALVHPEDLPGLRRVIERSMEKHETLAHEFRIVRPDAAVRWLANRAQTEYNQEGRPVRHFGIAIDITERKRAEENVLEYQRLLKSVTDNASVSLFIMDEHQQCVFMNPAAEKLTGFSLDEVRGKALHDLIHHTRPDGSPYPLSECPIDQALPENNQEQGQEIFVRKDGSFYDVAFTASPIRNELGKALGTVVEVRDITDEKRAARALLESESVLRTVTNEAHVGLVMVNKERRYLFANHTYNQILGLPDENIVGKRVSDVLANVYDQIAPRLNEAFAGERLLMSYAVPVHPTTHDERFYEVVYEPRVENVADPYVVVVIVDITERKKMQHTLERMVGERTARLRETVGELEAFSYSIAHDMRAPLRAMQGFSNLLQEEYGSKLGDGKEYLRRIAASANRLDALIQDVLNYSKIIRSNLPLGRTDLAKFIREIIESYPNLHPPRVDIQVDEPMPMVLANSAALTQVVSNLLGNAVKFVGPGVKPKVRVWAERRPGDMVRIWFEDNGIGIPTEVQGRIFMMFQRLNPPDQYEGTGIGLTIVRKAVDRMGGKVGLESEPGRGSRFWIELKEASKN